MLRKTIALTVLALVLLLQAVIAQEAKVPGTDQTDRTIDACYKKISENPKSADPWRELGIAFYNKGDLTKAEDAFKQANTIQPQAQTNLCLGLVFERLGQTDKAIDAYTAALNLNPKGKIKNDVRSRLDRLMADKFKNEATQVVANEASIKASEIPDNTIAVVNFDGSRLSPDMSQIGMGFAEFTANDLSKVHSLRVVDRLKLDILMQELKLGQSGAVDPKTAPRVGRLVGGKQVITGSLISSGQNQIRLDGAIVNTTDSSANLTKPAEGDVQSFFKIEKAFVFNVLDKLGITPTAEEREAINKVPTESYLAFLAYCKGLDYEQRGMFNDAAGAFNTAAGHDKNFAEPKVQLGTVAALSGPPPSSPESFHKFQGKVISGGPGVTTGTGLDASLSSLARNLGPLPIPNIEKPPLMPPIIAPMGTVIIRGRFDVQ